jgi:hypothetical protein
MGFNPFFSRSVDRQMGQVQTTLDSTSRRAKSGEQVTDAVGAEEQAIAERMWR